MLRRRRDPLDGLQQQIGIDGLGKQCDGSTPFDMLPQIDVAPAREHNDRQGRPLFPQIIEQFEPAHFGHMKIDNQAALFVPVRVCEKGFGRRVIAH